jgi:hypothetical protein
MIISDVPSPIDLRQMSDASEWAATAMEKRPWRAEFFARFADELANMEPTAARVLELGSGPGFLAVEVFTAVAAQDNARWPQAESPGASTSAAGGSEVEARSGEV